MRVGLGYDIHRVAAGLPLVLGGVRIPSDVGLAGHSDADVVVHALMDALLGAASLGDIGRHFPPSDEHFRGMSSLLLLHEVHQMVSRSGYKVINADIMVVAEQPRLGPHTLGMQEEIARVLGIEVHDVSVKATTNEGVGAEGRQEAISAQAVVLLESAG
ncbi:MAG: 2-C-methyl-D-erythritol 2,4-cyclodiphosphate synthase [Chloroflexota bacterium]